jgi:hypothetical protein
VPSDSEYGNQLGLIVSVRAGRDGRWYLDIDGTARFTVPLRPAIFTVRLNRSPDNRVLQGRIRLGESEQWVPIRTNEGMEELLRGWLLDDVEADEPALP